MAFDKGGIDCAGGEIRLGKDLPQQAEISRDAEYAGHRVHRRPERAAAHRHRTLDADTRRDRVARISYRRRRGGGPADCRPNRRSSDDDQRTGVPADIHNGLASSPAPASASTPHLKVGELR